MARRSAGVVSARAARTLADVKRETLATILLETTRGAPIMIIGTVVASEFPARTQDHFQLIGRHASAVFAGRQLQRLGPQPESIPCDIDAGYQASFDAVIELFVECLQSGARFETGAADNLETLRPAEHDYLAAGLHDQPES